jgi:hypothetical protein
LILPLAWGWVPEMVKGFDHFVGHQKVDFSSIVIPFDGKATKLFALPAAQTLVELLHGV